jgi:agmatine deiminase
MITDNQTNFLYLADTLPEDYPGFFQRFKKILTDHNISFALLPSTRDVWAVDYMPIQISEEKFIQFKYEPDYLREYPDYRTKPQEVLSKIGIEAKPSEINLDGGNVVKTPDKVIMCDKIFHENPKIPEKELIERLKSCFEVDKIIFIPWDLDDFTGHADGMVRFIDSDTVLINVQSKYGNQESEISLRMALHNAGLEYKELPCYFPDDPTMVSARGLYLNYLQMENIIFMPVYNLKSDEEAYKVLNDLFKGYRIETVESSELAREGGVLNCITWNIKR